MPTVTTTAVHSITYSDPQSAHAASHALPLVTPASTHPFYASHLPPTHTTNKRPRSRKSFLTRLTNRLLLTATLLIDHLPAMFDLAIRLLGPALVLVQWLIFAGMHVLYYWHVVPALHVDYTRLPWSAITLLGYALYFTIMWHHTRAVFTHPGGLPVEVIGGGGGVVPVDIEARLEAEKGTYRKGLTFTRHCRTCLREKPPRTHHCPWIANCVGYHNYRHFFLYMLYLWLGCLYIIALVIPCLLTTRPNKHGVTALRVDMSDSTLFFALVLATGGWFGLTGMLAVHGWLVATGQTTLEMYVNGKRAEERKKRNKGGGGGGGGWWPVHEYDVGVRRNVEAMLGRGRWLVSSFLPGGATMTGNGLWYETREDWVDEDAEWLAA